MKYFTFIISIFLFVLSASALHAEAVQISLEPPRPLFEMQTLKITELDNGVSKFDMGVVQNDKNIPISYWKLRMYCGEGVSLNTVSDGKNKCGQAVTHSSSTLSEFSVFFDSNMSGLSNFSFKLKAYDTNGTWLHTEKKIFNWK